MLLLYLWLYNRADFNSFNLLTRGNGGSRIKAGFLYSNVSTQMNVS